MTLMHLSHVERERGALAARILLLVLLLASPHLWAQDASLPTCPDPGVCFVSQEAKDQWAEDQGCSFAEPEDEELSLSSDGEDLLKGIETLALLPYDDDTGDTITEWVNGATVGYGHLISKSEWDLYKGGITEQQALDLFRDDLAPFADAVNNTITVDMTQQQFDAMVILAFNIGVTGFNNSSVAKLVNDPDATTSYASLEDAWKAWNKSDGVVNNGLINRRNAEWNIYTDGVYEQW